MFNVILIKKKLLFLKLRKAYIQFYDSFEMAWLWLLKTEARRFSSALV